MISTLSKNGSGYTYSALRIFDAWGKVRVGATTGDPKGRYCASLGHRQDDESGLVYMRARYYEPGTGRFISEDPAMDGINWFAYCGGDPVNRVDSSGEDDTGVAHGLAVAGFIHGLAKMVAGAYVSKFAFSVAWAGLMFPDAWFDMIRPGASQDAFGNDVGLGMMVLTGGLFDAVAFISAYSGILEVFIAGELLAFMM